MRGDAVFDAVNALEAGIEFRRQAHLRLEDLDEATATEPDDRRDIRHAHSVPLGAKRIDGCAGGGVPRSRASQSPQKRRFHESKPLARRACLA